MTVICDVAAGLAFLSDSIMAEPSSYKIAVIGAGILGTRIAGEGVLHAWYRTSSWAWHVVIIINES